MQGADPRLALFSDILRLSYRGDGDEIVKAAADGGPTLIGREVYRVHTQGYYS